MRLKIYGSSSKGNAYLLYDEEDALLIEAGISWKEIARDLGAETRKIKACLITHEHGDHSKYARDIAEQRIPIVTTRETFEAIFAGVIPPQFTPIKAGQLPIAVGEFKIRCFDTRHDAVNPVGFIINHPMTGDVVFATDTYYLPYTFKGVKTMLIECNYDFEVLEQNTIEGKLTKSMRDRTLKSHMSLNTCLEAVRANDSRILRDVVLIHLSNRNGNADKFRDTISTATKANVWVAHPGLEIEIGEPPF